MIPYHAHVRGVIRAALFSGMLGIALTVTLILAARDVSSVRQVGQVRSNPVQLQR